MGLEQLINPVSRQKTALGDLAERTVASLFDDFIRNTDQFDTTSDGFFATLKLKVEIKCQDPWYNAGGLTITDNEKSNYFKCMGVDLLYFVVYQSDPTHPRGKANWNKVIIYKVIDRNKFERSIRHCYKNNQRHVERVIVYEWDNLEVVKEVTDLALANEFRRLSNSQFLLPN